ILDKSHGKKLAQNRDITLTPDKGGGGRQKRRPVSRGQTIESDKSHDGLAETGQPVLIGPGNSGRPWGCALREEIRSICQFSVVFLSDRSGKMVNVVNL